MEENRKSNELRRVAKRLISVEGINASKLFRAVDFKSEGKEYHVELTIKEITK